MITNKDLEISSMSYTNKDFGGLYTEILDVAKNITNEWDPSQSNESDPGVVLLKEAAFVGDHNNYNIDKNILENFLPSATQDRSVRNITEMNGYTPRYYVSATGNVSFSYSFEDEEVEQFTIPPFTIVVTDAANSVSYTQAESLLVLKDKTLSSSCKFIEGTLQTLRVNDSDTILLDNLDDNNRIYFPETYVAQNGVYVRYADNVSHTEHGYWTRNNFILAQPSGSRMFKVDYDSDKGLPYIEFPSDISSIIDSGLTINYISTSGVNGNVSAGALTKIVSPGELTVNGIERNMANFKVSNTSAISNGKDPETINEMYQSFKSIVGTFDTLVTCKDYSNAIYNMEFDGTPIVSNCYVTDRRTDYNKAASIIMYDEYGAYEELLSKTSGTISFHTSKPSPTKKGQVYLDGSTFYVVYEDNTDGVEASSVNLNDLALLTETMTPYDLVIYALKAYSESDWSDDNKAKALQNSFNPIVGTELGTTGQQTKSIITNYLNDYKCLSHNFDKDFDSSNELYYFKNYAPLVCSITPFTAQTAENKKDILNKVYKAISDNYNPRHLEWGENIDTSSLKNVILTADDRIRDVNLSPITYETKEVVYDSSTKSWKDNSVTNCTTTGNASNRLIDLIAKNIMAGRVCMFNFDETFDFKFGQKIVSINDYDTSIKTELPIAVVENEPIDYTNGKYQESITLFNASEALELSYKIIAKTSKAKAKTKVNDSIDLIVETDPDTGKQLADSIIINKKTADGSRQYIFEASLDETYTVKPDGAVLSNDGSLHDFSGESISISSKKYITASDSNSLNVDYTLQENESVQIIYPNYYSDKVYSLYVKYTFASANNNKIKANLDYTLQDGDELTIQYTTSENGEATTTYKQGDTVMSTFDISVSSKDSNGELKYKTLASNQTISHRVLMETVLKDSSYRAYWIVDNSDRRLFEVGSTTKILGSNEYFIYTTASGTINDFVILGSGTKLTRQDATADSKWKIDEDTDKSSIESISNYGSIAIPWQTISLVDDKLSIIEMSVVSLGKGDNIKITGWNRTKYVYDSDTVAVTTGTIGTTPSGDVGTIIKNKWMMCNGDITYNDDVTLPRLNNFYYIRSRFNLMMTNDSPQELRKITEDIIESEVKTGEVIKSIQRLYSGNNAITVYDAKYLMPSTTLALLGDDVISLSMLGKVSIIAFNKEETGPRSISVVYDSSKTSHSETYSLYCLKDTQPVIPAYISGSAVKIKATLKNSDGEINTYDFSSKYKSEKISTSAMLNNLYLITCDSRPKNESLTLTLSWTVDSQPNENESIIIADYKLVSGINNNLTLNDNNLESRVGERIEEIISKSDKPNAKFLYTYSPEDSMKIDLERYNVVDVKNSHYDSDGNYVKEYSLKAFDNALIMYDVNNIASDKTLTYIDLENSSIDVLASMVV